MKKSLNKFQKVVIQKSPSKRSLFQMCNFIVTYDFCVVKTVRNNDIPSEYRPTYIPFEGELSKLLARFFIVDLCLGIRFGMRVGLCLVT